MTQLGSVVEESPNLIAFGIIVALLEKVLDWPRVGRVFDFLLAAVRHAIEPTFAT